MAGRGHQGQTLSTGTGTGGAGGAGDCAQGGGENSTAGGAGLHQAGAEGTVADSGRRTLVQVRADVLTDLLLEGEPGDWPARLRGVRGQVTVIVPALALAEATGVLVGEPGSGPGAGWASESGDRLLAGLREPGCAEPAGCGTVPISRAPGSTR